MTKPIEVLIAEKVKEKGGTTYYVGGFVRDKLLGIENKDVDIEVHGIMPDTLKDILKELGTPLEYGKDFGIFSLANENIDIAMPRRERNTGVGHRDFDIEVDPFIGVKEAARRRDFTINSLMQDVLTNEIVDSFDGLYDLENKLIKHVDDSSFVEDPLRVFRACQFAARFNFKIAKETIELCKTIDVKSLSKERVEEELIKALLKSNNPSIFFNELDNMEKLDYWFTEIKELQGVVQDKIYHPEGDVYIHTMKSLDEACKYLDKVKNPYCFMMFTLCHDLGKIDTTFTKDGRIHSYGHEEKLDKAKKLVKRISNKNGLYKYLMNMIPLHMKPNQLFAFNAGKKATNKMYDEAIAKEDLLYFAFIDHPLKEDSLDNSKRYIYLKERLNYYFETMLKPYVTGDDLIESGITPDTDFKDALAYAHKLRLANVRKDDALKQTIAYINKKRKK